MTQSTLNVNHLRGKGLKTASYFAAFLVLGMTTSSLGPTLPALAQNTRTTLDQISFLFTARSLGYMIGSMGGGWLLDRLPGHPIVVIALLSLMLLLGVTPLINQLWLLLIIILLIGLAEGPLDVGCNTLLLWLYKERVGPFLNGLHLFFGIGAFISPMLVALSLLWRNNINWGYWSISLMILPIMLWIFTLSSPTIQSNVDFETIPRPVNNRLVVIIIGFLFLYVGAEVSFGGWISTFALKSQLTTEAEAAYLASAFWAALTLGRVISIPLAIRFRPRHLLLSALTGAILSISLIILMPHSLLTVWGGTLGVGMSMATIFPTTLSFAERQMPLSGRTTGGFFAGASLGASIIPLTIGQLFEMFGPLVVMLTVWSVLLLNLGLLFMLLATASKK